MRTRLFPTRGAVLPGRRLVSDAASWFVASLVTVLTGGHALWAAPGAGSLDPSFDPTGGGQVTPFAGGEAAALAVAVQADGKVIIGGRFESVNAIPRNNLARVNPDGSLDSSFDPGLGTDGDVLALALQPDGRVVLGGRFLSVNGQRRARIARLLADGRNDPSFNAEARADGWVKLLALQADGKIVLAGSFAEVNGVAHQDLARLHPDGTLDSGFAAPPSLGRGAIRAIRALADGRLLVAGAFAGGIWRLNADGSVDPTFEARVEHGAATPEVFALDLEADGRIWITGHFSEVGGEIRRGLARLHADGRLDAAFRLQAEPNALPHAVLAQPEGKVLVGGWFNFVGGLERRSVARFNADGTLDLGFDAVSAFGFYGQPNINALASLTDGRLLVGLERHDGAYHPARVLMRLGADGHVDDGFGPYLDESAVSIDAIVLQPDGRALIRGEFAFREGNEIINLARLHGDGTLDLAFEPDWHGSGSALALQAVGKVLVGGPGFLARLKSDGKCDRTFVCGAELPEFVRSILVQNDGKILVGGGSYGVSALCLARLHPDGSPDPTFVPPPFPAGDDIAVHALALQGDGKVLVGGELGYANSPLPHALARLDPDGRLDATFKADWLASGVVFAIAIQADGRILVGGQLKTGDDSSTMSLARLNPDGTSDPAFQPPTDAGTVRALASQADGKVLVGGTSAGVVRLQADGRLDPLFQGELGFTYATPQVQALAIQPDGQVLVAGNFNSVSGIPRRGIVRLNNDRPPQQPDVLWSQGVDHGSMVAFSPGGTLVAAAVAGITVWQASDGRPVRSISGAFGGLVSLAFSPNSLRLAAGDADGKVRVWNVWDGGLVWSQRAGGDVTSVAFAPDGTLASWSSDESVIRLWRTADGTPLGVLGGHQWSHHNVAFSPDGSLVASGGDAPDYLVRLLQAADGALARSLRGHTDRVRAVAFSSDGTLLASAGDDATIRLWRVADGALMRVLSGHTAGVWKVALAANGLLASTSGDGTLMLWRLADGALLLSYSLAGIGSSDVEFSPDGSRFAYVAGGRLVVARTPLPAITSQPRSQTRFAGQSAEFNVLATGAAPFYYQWLRNGLPLAGATEALLKVPLVMPADAGAYSVVVSNVLGAVASAQASLTVLPRNPDAGLIDAGFDPTAGGELPGLADGRASVNSITLQPDGKVLFAGNFIAFNGTPRNRVARLNPDRSLDETFDPGIGTDGAVAVLALQGDGKVLIGGTFRTCDARPRSGLARLEADGRLDTAFQADVVNANVSCLRVRSDGKVWVGGNFHTVAGTARANLARLNPDGSLDGSFTPPASIAGDYDHVRWVQDLVEGKVLVGGHFESQRPLGGSDQNLVRLELDGRLDPTFQCELSGLFLSDAVLRPDGSILVAGMLHSWTGGSHYFALAELDSQGRVVREYSPEALPALVISARRQPDGKTLIGGAFRTVWGTSRNGLARLNADGSLDAGFDPSEVFEPALEPAVLALALQPDGRVWVGAEHAGWPDATRALALLDPDGGPAADFTPRLLGAAGAVTALAAGPEGRLLVGGAFTSFRGQPRNHLAQVWADGSLDYSFVPALSRNLSVLLLRCQPDGKVLVAGKVDPSAGPPSSGILRLNPDGSVDAAFSVTAATDGDCGYVRCLALQPDGKLLIGGEFNLPPRGLARLHPDGSVDLAFRPPDLPAWDEEGVHAVAVLEDGRILIGGDLDGLVADMPPTLARLHPDGRLDRTFDLGITLHGSVRTIVPMPNGKWLVGGIWADVQDRIRAGLLRLDAQGNLDTVLVVPEPIFTWPMAVEADGGILTGGPGMARLTPEGFVDPTFQVRLAGGASVNALLVQPDGRIVVGGQFSSLNGVPANNLARLQPALPPRVPFVERHLGPMAQVALVAQPPAGTSRYSVQDQPSWGPVQGLSHEGRYEPADGKVIFGPFNDGAPRTLTYFVVLPPGSAGQIQFQGVATADGLETPIVGDASLRIWEFPPPLLWVEARWRPLSQALVLQVWGQRDTTYTIEASRDLSVWDRIGAVSSPTGLSEFNDSITALPYRFYRVKEGE